WVAGGGVGVREGGRGGGPVGGVAGLDREEEPPIIFPRLRKAARTGRVAVYSLAPLATRGLAKMSGTLIPAPPGTETEVLTRLAAEAGNDPVEAAAPRAMTAEGAVILAGHRLARTPAALLP